MKIKFGTGRDPEWTEINVGSHQVLIQEASRVWSSPRSAFCGIGIETDWGLFSITARDGVLEIQFDGKLIIDSDKMKEAIDKAGMAIIPEKGTDHVSLEPENETEKGTRNKRIK
jgi:hypothetical protein